MKTEMNTLLETIKSDYAHWGNEDLTDVRKRMIEEFNHGLRVEEGSKYLKIITGNFVWGFVVKKDNDKKFRKGDILKAASWKTPARNAARGNILDGGYTIRWTGPLYLK